MSPAGRPKASKPKSCRYEMRVTPEVKAWLSKPENRKLLDTWLKSRENHTASYDRQPFKGGYIVTLVERWVERFSQPSN